MKLLIITQKIDLEDDILGFMHDWVFEFAKHCEKVTVICLYEGSHELPRNVKILSLGKEDISQKSRLPKSGTGGQAKVYKIKSRLLYVFNFYKHIWRERKNYNKVFVHMNKEYVVLGGIFWRLTGNKVALWYNHLRGNIFSRVAGMLVNIIFYTSPFSFFSKNKKAHIMPAGINTDIFEKNPRIKKAENSLLFLGRISPVKNVDTLINASILLDKQGKNFVLNIVGEAGENDRDYYDKIKERAKELEAKGKVKFLGKAPNYKTPKIYNQNEIFINLTNSGSMDKTTLEAMACESLVLVSNKSFKKIFPSEWRGLMIFKENDEKDLAKKLIKLINLSEEGREKISKISRELVVKNHSLKKLVKKIIDLF